MATQASMAGQRGVTLIELLIVVLILSILVGIAGIPGGTDSAWALDLAEVQLKDAFDTARTLSYSMGVPHGVVFDPVNDRFAVVAQDGMPARDPLTHGEYVVDFNTPGQPQGLHVLSANFGSTGQVGIFDGQGVPVEGGLVTVTKGPHSRVLLLDAATGQLQAQ